MKLLLSFLLSLVAVISTAQVNLIADKLTVRKYAVIPQFADTLLISTGVEALRSMSMINTYGGGVEKTWRRNKANTRWDEVGASPTAITAPLTEGITLGGLVTWSGSGLTYDVTPAWYVKNQIQYSTPASQFTLSAADATFSRIDVPAVNTTPAVVVVPGTAAAQPVIPQVDPATDLPLTSIIVPAGATTPSVSQAIWYDVNAGNPTEANWAVSGGTVTFSNLTNPFHATHAINVSPWTANTTMTGTWATTVSRSDLALLKMAIDLRGNMSSSSNIVLRFLNGTTIITANYTLGAANGFSKIDIGYQNVVIPLSAIAFSSNNFTKLQIIVTGSGPGMYIDYVQFQSGINPGTGGGAEEVDPSAWHITGNSAIDSATNFIGPINTSAFNIRTGNVQRFSFAKDRAEIQTFTNIAASQPFGGGFYVNGGNKNPLAVTYPGANMAISGGHTGYRALDSITGGYWNIAIGDLSLNRTKDGYDNVAIGFGALKNTVGGFRNTFIGSKAGGEKATHYADVAIGDEAMMNVVGSHDNTAVGSYAMRGEWGATIYNTTAVGVYACAACGNFNVAVGANAMQDTYMEGIENVNVGAYTCGTCGGIREMAKGNVVLGYMSGFEGLTGDNNNVMGRYAGAYNNFGLRMSGSRNNIFGAYTNGYVSGADGNIAIGSYISNPLGNGGDATLNIGNVIFGSNMYNGTSPSSTPVVGGKIGLRVKIPLATLHIDSDTTDVSGLRFQRLTSASATGTGSPLGVDANGKVIVIAGGGATPTWQQTLTAGSTLTANNAISTGTNTFTISGAAPASVFEGLIKFSSSGGSATNSTLKVSGDQNNAPSLVVANSSTATGATGVSASATNGKAISGSALGTGVAGYFYTNSSIPIGTLMNSPTAGVVSPAISLNTGATGTDGLGNSIDFRIASTTTGAQLANQIISKWTSATHASRTSEFSIKGVNNGATEATLFTLSGDGKLKLNNYTGTTFDAAAFKSLGVNVTGELVTFTGSGPAMTQLELIKRLTTRERTRYRAIEGEIVYDKTTHSHWFWNGRIWKKFN